MLADIWNLTRIQYFVNGQPSFDFVLLEGVHQVRQPTSVWPQPLLCTRVVFKNSQSNEHGPAESCFRRLFGATTVVGDDRFVVDITFPTDFSEAWSWSHGSLMRAYIMMRRPITCAQESFQYTERALGRMFAANRMRALKR